MNEPKRRFPIPHPGALLAGGLLVAMIAVGLSVWVTHHRQQDAITEIKRLDESVNHQAELNNVALCFRKAVSVLQAEPETPDDLAEFMQKAKVAVRRSDGSTSTSNFNAIRWNQDGTFLVTVTGRPIYCRVAGETHYNYGQGGTAWSIEYEFFVPGTDYRSQTAIELAFR